MNQALRTLLAGVIDYAGLFPPARLPLETAVRDFAEYRGHQDAWMLRHFVIPAPRLSELSQYTAALATGASRWTLSVLGRPSQTRDEWKTVLTEDLQFIAEFAGQHRELASVAALELPLPAEFSAREATPQMVSESLDELAGAILPHNFRLERVFLEVPAGDAAEENREALSRGIGGRGGEDLSFGLKLRTGGLEPAAFPSVEQLARVIDFCQRDGVAWKATAGLHHPLPHRCAEVGAMMHGFLNLLVAVTLAGTLKSGTAESNREMLEQVLREENAENFTITSDGLRWQDHQVSTAAIEAARERFLSFGSCSFDEPRGDLQELGYELAGCDSISG